MPPFNRTSARPKLVEPSGFESPARANLAIAIRSRDALRASAEQVRVARLNYESDKLQPLREAVERLNAALGAAKADVTAGIVDGIAQDNAPPPKLDLIRQARLDLQVARDELAAAEDAYSGLEPRREQLEKEADAADREARRLAAAVLREHPAVATIVREHERHMREYLRTLGIIRWLASANAFGIRDEHGYPLDFAGHNAVEMVVTRERQPPCEWSLGKMSLPGGFDGITVRGGAAMQQASAPWEAAFRTLQSDANAPLPETGDV